VTLRIVAATSGVRPGHRSARESPGCDVVRRSNRGNLRGE
jgi:hypothetical protein